MPQEETDEYLEAIYDIAGKDGVAKTTEIAKRLELSPASVTEVMQRMAEKKLVNYTPYKGVSLSKKGLAHARRIKRKHRILERFLHDILGLDQDKVHEQACLMEHTLTDETEEAMCKMLKGAERCPHGRAIPPCNLDFKTCHECLSEKTLKASTPKSTRPKHVIPITDLKPHQKAKIAFIRGGNKVIQRLADLGLTPGTSVFLERSAPFKGPVEIVVRGSSLAVGRGIAEKIFIEPKET
ncbi:MAG: metal-dependent transcriptional regulator [Thermoplasmata archaeon]|nr:MAG: metal-dependent transcriptional regulator [Thermoplasmata archaeon]